MVNRRALLPVPMALALLGLILGTVGVLGMTVLRPDGRITASEVAPLAPYTITHGGVLNLVDPPTEVTAKAANPGDEVTVALGRPGDVAAWVEGLKYREIDGLVTWKDLKTEEHSARPEPPEVGELAQSDMWLRSVTRKGEVHLTVEQEDAELSIIAATDGVKPAPTLTLSWQRPVSVAWAISLTAVGGILVLLALALFFQRRHQQRTREQRERALTRQRQRRKRAEVIKTQVAGKDVKLPSRQAIRQARERGEKSVTVGGQTFDTGLIPVVKKVSDGDRATSTEPAEGKERRTSAKHLPSRRDRRNEAAGEHQ